MVMCHKYVRYLRQTNTTMYMIMSPVKQIEVLFAGVIIAGMIFFLLLNLLLLRCQCHYQKVNVYFPPHLRGWKCRSRGD